MTLRILVKSLAVLVFFAAASRATADVQAVSENGFTVTSTLTLSVPPARAYAAMTEVAKWWESAHTWSGDARNLSIDAKPQGCWCEKLPGGGGVRHMTVVFASPGKLLRLEGGLGPLQAMAVSGVMTWKFDPAEKGTAVQISYVVGGYNPGGFKDLAPGVDGVLKQQIDRYKKYAETGKP